MMERKTGEEANESAAPATSTSISHFRKVDDEGAEYQLRASLSPPINTEGDADVSQQPQSSATIDHLEQQIRRHLSDRSQAQHDAEHQWDSQRPNANDAWGRPQPPPFNSQPSSHRSGLGQDVAWDRPIMAVGDAPSTGLRREGHTGNSPPFHMPAPALHQVSTSFVLPQPLITHPLPGSANQSSAAAMPQRIQTAAAFPSAAGGGGGLHAEGGGGGDVSGAMERSSSIPAPHMPPLYNHLHPSTFSPSSFTYETMDRNSYRQAGRNFHPEGGSPLPFPIINIPFRSKRDRAAEAPAGDSEANSGIATSGAVPDAATAAGANVPSPHPALLWTDHLPSSGKEPTFPMKLHQILSCPQFQGSICWNNHGRSWRIIKTQEFERTVIPLFFQHSKYSSFLRQVNGWGFERIVTGADHGSYFSRYFLRDNPSLCLTMKRKAKKKKQSADEAGPAREPAGRLNPPTNADVLASNWRHAIGTLPLHATTASPAGVGSTRDGTSAVGSGSYAAPATQLRPPNLSVPEPGGGGYASSYARGAGSSVAVPPRSRDLGEHSRGTAHMMMGLEDLNRLYFMQSRPIVQQRGGDVVTALGHNPSVPAHNANFSATFHHTPSHEMAPNLAFRHDSPGMGGEVGGSTHQGWLVSHSQPAMSSTRPEPSQDHRPQEGAAYHRLGANDAVLSSSSGDDWNHPGGPPEEASGAPSGALPLGAMSPLHFGEEDDSTTASAE